MLVKFSSSSSLSFLRYSGLSAIVDMKSLKTLVKSGCAWRSISVTSLATWSSVYPCYIIEAARELSEFVDLINLRVRWIKLSNSFWRELPRWIFWLSILWSYYSGLSWECLSRFIESMSFSTGLLSYVSPKSAKHNTRVTIGCTNDLTESSSNRSTCPACFLIYASV